MAFFDDPQMDGGQYLREGVQALFGRQKIFGTLRLSGIERIVDWRLIQHGILG
jgi:hypothetical protein